MLFWLHWVTIICYYAHDNMIHSLYNSNHGESNKK